MAHERGDVTTVGVYSGGRDASAEELQRLLRARRESITQTVEEIKMTMNSGYQDTKQQVSQTFDWRHQMRQHPLSAVAGAVAIGLLAGQILGRTMSHSGTRSTSGGGTSGTRSRILTGSSFGAGTSMSPESRSSFESSGRSSERHEHREPRHFIPPAVKSRVGGRFEETVSDMAENLLSELSRVGREVLIPTIVGRLTSAITHEGSTSQSGGGQQRRSYSPKSTTESSSSATGSPGVHGTAAGGPINQSGEDQGRNRFQGRGI